jgi:hypothetical protein
VLVCSSKVLSMDEQALMHRLHAAFLAKDRLDGARLAQGLREARRTAPRGADSRNSEGAV